MHARTQISVHLCPYQAMPACTPLSASCDDRSPGACMPPLLAGLHAHEQIPRTCVAQEQISLFEVVAVCHCPHGRDVLRNHRACTRCRRELAQHVQPACSSQANASRLAREVHLFRAAHARDPTCAPSDHSVGGVVARQLHTPEVGSAGERVAGSNLCHAQDDTELEGGD